jgi:soluble lytic murein transglycosylase-like protein
MLLAPVLVVIFGLAMASAGDAQVLEIGDGGAVTVHDRPEVTLTTGAVPIKSAPPLEHSTVPVQASAALSRAAANVEVSADLLEAVGWRESRLRPGVVSRAGAIGEMQLMPGTAQALKVNPYDTSQNFAGGATYLKALLRRYDGEVILALAAYNAGPGAVDRYGGVPPFKETRDYVAAILDRLSQRATGAPER